MNLTARDKKIALFLAPIALVGIYWMFVLSPKRDEAAKLSEELVQAEQARDQVQAQAGSLQGARENYANDYAVVVRLGKAIPTTVDMPSLIVQLDRAAKGTGIRFSKVVAGARTAAVAETAEPAAPAGDDAPAGEDTPAAQPGGEQAQTGLGKTAEQAGEAGQTSDERNAAGGADAPAPVAGEPAPGGATAAPGLDSVPLQFSFTGGFFDLADFFHEMKRFVYVANGRVKIHGRLLTIDSFKFDSTAFPALKTDVQATVYLSPKEQGVTAGATPTGPAPGAPATPAQAQTPPAAPETATPANSTEGIQ